MGDALEAREGLEQLRFLAGPLAEVGGYRVADAGPVFPQHAGEPREAIAAHSQAGIRIRGERLSLDVEGPSQWRRMGHGRVESCAVALAGSLSG